jgi:hypothetical protein
LELIAYILILTNFYWVLKKWGEEIA